MNHVMNQIVQQVKVVQLLQQQLWLGIRENHREGGREKDPKTFKLPRNKGAR